MQDQHHNGQRYATNDHFDSQYQFYQKSDQSESEQQRSAITQDNLLHFKFGSIKLQTQHTYEDGLTNFKPQKNIYKNTQYYDIEKLIKNKITQKICNKSNKNLYPMLMGPHPFYTIQNFLLQGQKNDSVDLAIQLQYWKRKFLKVYAIKRKYQKLSVKLENNDVQIDEQINKVKSEQIMRSNGKYNKYTLEFKRNLVNKIQQQMQAQGSQSKSLRHYITKQANFLHIHPKNITRWFQMKDLQNHFGGRKAKFPQLQYNLAKYMEQNPNCKRRQVVQYAKKILSERGKNQNFNFSKGWYQRFKTRLRKNKVIRTIQSLICSSDKHLNNMFDERCQKVKSMQQFLCNKKKVKNQNRQQQKNIQIAYHIEDSQAINMKLQNQIQRIKDEEF